MMSIENLLVGVFGGGATTLLWEGLIKPHRERAAIARAIADEAYRIATDARQRYEGVNSTKPGANVDVPVSEFACPIFNALAARIGDMPSLSFIGRFYSAVALANAVRADWEREVQQMRTHQPSGPSGFMVVAGFRATAAQKAYAGHLREVIISQDRLINSLARDHRLLPFRRTAFPRVPIVG
jgi:hypothetical protein